MVRYRFLTIMVLLFCVWGCGDEGMLLNDLAPSAPSLAEGVTAVPAHIQSLLWDE